MQPIIITGRVIKPNETVKRLNPHMFGVGAVANPERKRDQRSSGKDQELGRRPSGLEYCVTIVSFRRKRVDGHDNLRTGAKPLVDRITETLGFASDDDPRLHWEYQQVITTGQEGTIVKIDEVML